MQSLDHQPPSAAFAQPYHLTMLKPEPACLAIADITGYTRFLAGTELDHAQDILADLTNTVPAEPDLPVSRGRMVTEPMTAAG
jgi:hypothetical protein